MYGYIRPCHFLCVIIGIKHLSAEQHERSSLMFPGSAAWGRLTWQARSLALPDVVRPRALALLVGHHEHGAGVVAEAVAPRLVLDHQHAGHTAVLHSFAAALGTCAPVFNLVSGKFCVVRYDLCSISASRALAV